MNLLLICRFRMLIVLSDIFILTLVCSGLIGFDLLNISVVHVRLIKSLVERKDIATLRDRIIPLFGVIVQDKEEAVVIEFLSVVTSIVKLFSETDMDETCSVCGDLLPLLMSVVTGHSDSVYYIDGV